VRATSSRQETRRGHARHETISRVSSSRSGTSGRLGTLDTLRPVRVKLLVNSTASSVTSRIRVLVRRALAAHFDVSVDVTSRRGHAIRLARAAADDGYDVVVVLAGDGTLNEAAEGVVGTPTAIVPLPGGSTNVYARTLGLPDDPLEATDAVVAAIARRSFQRIGVGRVDGRRFLFHAGLGFDAAVIEQVERHGELKRHAPHPLYVLSAVATWFGTYDRRRPRFDLVVTDVDGRDERIDACGFAIVAKTTPYTYLGRRPINVAPTARIDAPLAVTAFRSLDVVTLVGGAASAMASGRFLASRGAVVQRDRLVALRVEGRIPFPYQVDGDFLGNTDGLDIVFEPDAITLVVP
jgi:diacylglycerol kinase family enzyme